MSGLPRVVITDFIAGPLETERRILGEVAEIVALDAASEDELVGKIEVADAIMMYHTVSITEKTIQRLKHCKLIGAAAWATTTSIGGWRERELPWPTCRITAPRRWPIRRSA